MVAGRVLRSVDPASLPAQTSGVGSTDAATLRAREAFETSGPTPGELGRRVGYEGGVARRGAWRLPNDTGDPRLGTLRTFAEAVGVPAEGLVAGPKKGRSVNG